MNIRTKALLVHLLTASGAVFAMLSLLAAVQNEWGVMYLWLVVAFVVDGIDGPLARRYRPPHAACWNGTAPTAFAPVAARPVTALNAGGSAPVPLVVVTIFPAPILSSSCL